MATETWQVDSARSDITFTLRHLVVSEISGHVRRWQATLRIDPQDPAGSSMDAVLDARSIDTGEAERDEHIRSREFLNVEVFPEIRFRSRTVKHVQANRYHIVGDLTIREVTHEVGLDMVDLGRRTSEKGAQIASFSARGILNRQQFSLRWNQDLDTGGVVVGDKVDIRVAVEAVLDQPSETGTRW
jgi:polyisoprenoid-binding protein YceI